MFCHRILGGEKAGRNGLSRAPVTTAARVHVCSPAWLALNQSARLAIGWRMTESPGNSAFLHFRGDHSSAIFTIDSSQRLRCRSKLSPIVASVRTRQDDAKRDVQPRGETGAHRG